MRLRAGVVTDCGLVRPANEDSFFLRRGLYAVCDGMGGARAGEVASEMACLGLLALDPATAGGRELRTAVTNVNHAIISRSLSDERLLGMGTTMTAALIREGTLFLAHVGDSRAYLFRDGRLEQLTDDHSWVGELVRRGELTPAQAAAHPQRSIITRALGTDLELEPDLREVELREGDRLLLCTDGLSGLVAESDLAEILSRPESPQTVAELLVKAALEAGGDDNVTAIVVDVLPEGDIDDELGDRILVGPADREGGMHWARRIKSTLVREKLGLKPGAKSKPEMPEGGEPGESAENLPVAGPSPALDSEQEVAEDQASVKTRTRYAARRRWLFVAVGVAVLLVAVVGFAIFNSTVYYVGEHEGKVALYRGLPATVAGIELSAAIELGSVSYETLDPYLRSRVDAHELVSKQEGQRFLRMLETLDDLE